MRLLIDLPTDHIEALDRLSKEERRSRTALIRSVLADYLRERERECRHKAMEAAFGLWKDRGIDGLEYQERIRAEWDRDPAA